MVNDNWLDDDGGGEEVRVVDDKRTNKQCGLRT